MVLHVAIQTIKLFPTCPMLGAAAAAADAAAAAAATSRHETWSIMKMRMFHACTEIKPVPKCLS